MTGTFATADGASITTPDGASITFTANAIREESGAAYTGNVNVYATWLDPTSPDLIQRMPGDLRATNVDNQQQQLITFGMIGVELEGDAGEALNIAEGQTATIEFPVPNDLLSGAPNTIPLWHFDELTGYWVEEGEATLQGDKYIGTVSHFSFWNVDLPRDFIFIEGIVLDRDGLPLENILVRITETSTGVSAGDWTDEDGAYSGAVPSNEELTLSILNNCDEVIFSESIGTFAVDATIPTITVSAPEEDEFITISGVLIDCDNNPIQNGYLKVVFDSRTTILSADENGGFNGTISICGIPTIEITGYDLTNSKQSGITLVTLDTSTVNLANVFVCENLSEVLNFFVGEQQSIDIDPIGRISVINGISNSIRLGGLNSNPAAPPSLILQITDVTGPGTYTPFYMDVGYFDDTLQTTISNYCEDMDCDVSVEITTYEGLGGFVIGSFSGILPPSPFLGIGEVQEVSGTFKIRLE